VTTGTLHANRQFPGRHQVSAARFSARSVNSRSAKSFEDLI